MGYYISIRLGYHEGDALDDSVAVPQRPSVAHEWDGDQWVLNTKTAAMELIARLEMQQQQRLTPRGDREFRLAVYQALSALPGLGALANHPAFLALKALDDAIKVERAKL